jgi:hypothetical protein
VIGPCGYGRYDDDTDYVGCPRAKSDMTPCIARDGHTALADDLACVGCRGKPGVLIRELADEGIAEAVEFVKPRSIRPSVATQADKLRDLVRAATEPSEIR